MRVKKCPVIILAVLCLGALACDPGPPGSPGSGPEAGSTDEATTAMPCAPGTDCLPVNANGKQDPAGKYLAQCSSRFPDFIQLQSSFPADYGGPWFEIADNFPTEPPDPGDLPWIDIDFQTDPDAYLYALRDYSYEGMIEANFRPQDNPVRPWFHVPMMNFGNGSRELVHGLTRERTLKGPELGIKEGVSVRNYAIGFYNELGGYTIGQVWQSDTTPNIEASQFEEGTMVFKILFTAATCDDFSDPDPCIVDGAPEWEIAVGGGKLQTVRLLQMDLATRDSRSPTGWVYGTFAYDTSAVDEDPWLRMRPVGLMWGNDPGATPSNGQPIEQSLISYEAPQYAKDHLGWAGRLNGPVDNPISACLSCHGTAQYPVDAALAPFSSSCDTDAKKLYWFRNLAVGEAFGKVSSDCEPAPVDPPPVSLDTSLQIGVSVQNVLDDGAVNPCAPEGAAVAAEGLFRREGQHRITRGGDEE